jgi:hypothetical protein
MAAKSENAKVKRKQTICTFPASPEDIARWKAAARELDRPLSWWIRNRLNEGLRVNVVEEKQEVVS